MKENTSIVKLVLGNVKVCYRGTLSRHHEGDRWGGEAWSGESRFSAEVGSEVVSGWGGSALHTYLTNFLGKFIALGGVKNRALSIS